MKKYSYLHELDKPKDDFRSDNDLANFLEENFDKLDKNQKMALFMKIVEEGKLDKELLRYQIRYGSPIRKDMDITSFLKKVNKLLKRYHRKAGGFYLEDKDWGYYEEKKSYSKDGVKYVLSNTIDVLEGRDREIHDYMTDLVSYLNKISQFKVSYVLTEDDVYKISYIEIIIE